MLTSRKVCCSIRLLMTIRRFLGLALLVVLVGIGVAQTDQPAKPMKVRVSAGVAEGLKIHDVSPKYPKEARERGIDGEVLLQATIDTKGHVVNLKAIQGDPILVEPSIDAVRQWKYRPYLLKGEPVEVETMIKIQFHMR